MSGSANFPNALCDDGKTEDKQYAAKNNSQAYDADAKKNQMEKNNSASQKDRLARLFANRTTTVLKQVYRFGWLFPHLTGNTIFHLLVS